jgi:AcrR family transcriptional regulator
MTRVRSLSTATPRRRSRDERRAQIGAATLAILAEDGLHAWTTAALARRVGVSEASLFRHFRDKDEILVSAVSGAADSLGARIREYRGEGPAWEQARGLIGELLGFVEETGGAPLVLLSGHVLRISPALRRKAGGIHGLLHARMTELFAEAQAGGRTGAGTEGAPRAAVEPRVLADLAIAVTQSAGMRWMLSGRRLPLRRTAMAMFDVLRRCLAE